jgi:hypothetical protein
VVNASVTKGKHQAIITLPSETAMIRISAANHFTDFAILSTTPIPLPQRGWVGSLPDGTADKLTLDGAGHVEWVRATHMTTGSWTQYKQNNGFVAYNKNGQIPSDRLDGVAFSNMTTVFGTFSSDNMTRAIIQKPDSYGNAYAAIPESIDVSELSLLYPLATPVTEDMGYVDMPEIPSDAVVSIPELDNLGIKFFLDSSVETLAKQWGSRVSYERDLATADALSSVAPMETSPATTNHAVGDLITYQNKLYRVTVAIATGEAIVIGTNVTATTVAEQLAALNG